MTPELDRNVIYSDPGATPSCPSGGVIGVSYIFKLWIKLVIKLMVIFRVKHMVKS